MTATDEAPPRTKRVKESRSTANDGEAKPLRPSIRPRGSLVAAIDIGTTKVCCFIARRGEDGRPRVVGIGETGLDYHYDNSPREAQERGFRTHIGAAREKLNSSVPYAVC